jgi:hypothetical protein
MLKPVKLVFRAAVLETERWRCKTKQHFRFLSHFDYGLVAIHG